MKKTLSDNSKDFWVSSHIKRMSSPSSLEFLREGVSFYEPVIISNLINNWKARKKWSLNYIKERCKGQYHVNITPNGYADSVIDEVEVIYRINQDGIEEIEERKIPYFFYPAEVQMNMELFTEMISNPQEDDAIPYLSQQNNNLVNYFPELLEDIEPSLQLAIDAFGTDLPEALNLWIGDERSVSSLHKDHFENMYAVITGEKIFTLFPPTDIAFLNEQVFPTKRYYYTKNNNSNNDNNTITTRIKKEDIISTCDNCPSTELPWIRVDPENPNAIHLQPSLKYATPIRVKVKAGEVLYIPSMWYHRVTQSCPTIAVNYWYEQQFNFRYVFYQLARSIAQNSNQITEESENEENNQETKE